MNPKRLSCLFSCYMFVLASFSAWSQPVLRDIPFIPPLVLETVVRCQGTIRLLGQMSGGGCLVNRKERLVLTAMHVAIPEMFRRDGRVKLPESARMSFDLLHPETLEQTSIPIEHIYYYEGDLALLRIAHVPSWMRPAAIAQTATFDTLVGKEFYSVSYGVDVLYGKKMLFRIPSRGVVLDVPLVLDSPGREREMSYAYISAPVEPGSSGMPYYDETGSIVGVAHAMHGHYSIIALATRVPLMMELDGKIPPLGEVGVR